MAQGDNKTKTPGNDCIFAMDHAEIVKMHREDRKPTYARIVVDY